MFRLIVMTVGVAVAIGFALGCGGEDEAESAPLTKAEFIEQADAICAESAKELQADVAVWKEKFPKPAEVEKNLDDGARQILAPSLQREAKELEALSPPAKDEAEVSRMIESLSKAGKAFAKEGEQAFSRPQTQQFEQEAAAYGLKACGSVLG